MKIYLIEYRNNNKIDTDIFPGNDIKDAVRLFDINHTKEDEILAITDITGIEQRWLRK